MGDGEKEVNLVSCFPKIYDVRVPIVWQGPSLCSWHCPLKGFKGGDVPCSHDAGHSHREVALETGLQASKEKHAMLQELVIVTGDLRTDQSPRIGRKE